MKHNDEAYATMLLTTSIRPDREELAEPMSNEEFFDMRKRVREHNMRLSDLIGMDMSALMMRLDMTEDEAYRAFLLLSRMLPLSISLEKIAMHGIDFVTYTEDNYPAKLRKRLVAAAPAMLYYCGRPEIFKQDAIAIIGAANVRGNVKEEVASLVKIAVDRGFTIVTDGTTGIARIARDEAIAHRGKAIEVVSGEMAKYVERPDITASIALCDECVISQEHPDKPFTLACAQARNKIVYGLCKAAFIFGVEKNSGALWQGAYDSVRKRWCSSVYVWDTPLYEDNAYIMKRGARPFDAITPEQFDAMHVIWKGIASVQISMFDNEEPL